MASSKPSPHETLSIYLGTPAANLAVNNWELLSIEHNLKPDGTIQSLEDPSSKLKFPCNFFTETKSGKNVPKALLIDLDPSPLAEIRQGVYRNLFDSDALINGKFSANLYSIAYSEGKLLIPRIMDKIRKIADNCENLDNIMIYSSLFGGSGSGLSALLLEKLADSYERSEKIGINFYPSEAKNHGFYDYNTGFSMLHVLPLLDVSIAMKNTTISSLCEENFSSFPVYYSSINRVISQYISGITAGNRCEGALTINLSDLKDFLVPNSPIKCLVPSIAPLTFYGKMAEKENSVYEITNSLFYKNSSLIDCDIYKKGVFAANLYYRGDISPNEIGKNLMEFEKNTKFINGSSRKFNVSLNFTTNPFVIGGDVGRYSKSCCSLANGKAFSGVFAELRDSYKEGVLKGNYQNWIRKYDEGFEMLGGDLMGIVEKYQENIDLYEEIETEIIEEIY